MLGILVTAVTAAVLLTACGTSGSGTDSRRDPVAPTGATSSPTSSPTSPPTTPPSEQLEKIRVVGQVSAIGDCVVVRDDNQITWTITGPLASELVLHDRVQVTGTPDIRATGCGGPVVEATRTAVLPPTE